MNEQLIVKNFGPIKDATVDFKRVTVFIGPTGGGKSTLAKLAAIFSNPLFWMASKINRIKHLSDFGIDSYLKENSKFTWFNGIDKLEADSSLTFDVDPEKIKHVGNITQRTFTGTEETVATVLDFLSKNGGSLGLSSAENKFGQDATLKAAKFIVDLADNLRETSAKYINAERILLSALDNAWPDLIREKVNLPNTLLDFAKQYLKAREAISELVLPMLNVVYQHKDGRDTIKSLDGSQLLLSVAASGIQSVTPMLVLLEHLSRNTEQVQSFIIEEPELNLYPTAQQGLLNWLVEKCTKGENDLTITTHSPYLLAHLNLLLFAFQVAEKHPDRAEDVAKIIPRESWIDPKEFAAYHVEGQQENGVRSIVNPETGLISYNGLDAIASAETSEFEKLLDINAGLEVE